MNWRWFYSVFSTETRRLLAYRTDFWIHFIGGVVTQIGLAYFLWRAVFDARGVDTLNGFSFNGLMMYYLLVPLIERMIRGPEMSRIAQEIYEGQINRYLLFPIGFFRYKYATHLAYTLIFTLQFVIVLILFLYIFGLPEGVRISREGILGGFLLVFLGTLVSFSMAMILEIFAFWADHVWSLMVMLRLVSYFAGGGMIPLEFFPDWSRRILEMTPFPYLASYPIRAFQGGLSGEGLLQASLVLVGWAVVFSVLLRITWNQGLRKYTGVGI